VCLLNTQPNAVVCRRESRRLDGEFRSSLRLLQRAARPVVQAPPVARAEIGAAASVEGVERTVRLSPPCVLANGDGGARGRMENVPGDCACDCTL